MRTEIFDDDEILNFVNEIETLASVDRTIEDIKKDFEDEIEKLGKSVNIYLSENDIKILKSRIPCWMVIFN